MNRWVPPEVILDEKIKRLTVTHPYRVTLTLDPVERDHLVRTVGARDDVEVVGEALAGFRRITLEMVCADAEIADGLLNIY